MDYYVDVLKKYAVFSGRARRKEYWFFCLINAFISIVLNLVDSALGTMSIEHGVGVIGSLYTLAVLCPSIAVTVRRLHDTGRSGWWLAILLLPIIGALILLVFLLFNSEQGSNEYGDDPKADERYAA